MDAPRPLISVIIPCCNQGRFLAEAISSATARDFPVEIVVVDDGSTDDSAAVAAGFPSVTVIRQENRGLADARNRGFAESRGAFVIFLDADDRMLPGGIDAAGHALHAHPDCAMAYGRCVMMGPDGTHWPTPEQPIVTSGHYATLLRTNVIWMPAMAILRRDALRTGGPFREGIDAAADYDLYLRVAREHEIVDHGVPVAAYRRHPEAMSGNASRMLRETLAVVRRHRAAAAEAGRLDAWREGRGRWKGFYGTQLVEEIRAHLRARELRVAVRKGLFLAWHAPRVFVRELRRKLRVVFSGHNRQTDPRLFGDEGVPAIHASVGKQN